MEYTVLEVFEGIKNGKFKLDFVGHNSNTREEVEGEQLAQFLDFLRMDYDRNFNYIAQETATGRDLSDYKKYTIDQTISLTKGGFFTEFSCYDCNKRLGLTMTAENVFTAFNIHDFEPNKRTGEILRCEMENVVVNEALHSQIDVPTGSLIFANYFGGMDTEEKRKLYTMPDGLRDINSLLGRLKLMQYLAAHNVGYAQMGNMSVTFFANVDGDEIIVGADSVFHYDEDDDDAMEEEEIMEYPGFTKIGQICLDVWRWQCADRLTLAQHHQDIPVHIFNKPDTFGEYIEIKVKPGRWAIEHYYDIQGDENPIYSRLRLLK